MPVTYRPKVGEAAGINDWMGEDEWEVGQTFSFDSDGIDTNDLLDFE
jgi:hypothetical protein